MTSFKGCHPYSSVPSFSRHDHRLVRKSTIHHSKLSGKISRLATAAGEATAHPIRTRMPRMDTNKSVREIDGHKFPGYRLHLTPVRHQRSPSNGSSVTAATRRADCPGWFAFGSPPVPWVDALCYVSLPACAGLGSFAVRVQRQTPECWFRRSPLLR